ncbi:MAG: hypothetical protein IH842_05250 [Thaumarchaeota archaeon]|nr:hypothetical protein [Nitrososphaerota archaeon]
MESAYLKGRMRFGYEETITVNISNKILQDYSDSIILKNMEQVFGYVSAHAIINHVSKTVMKSRSDILSNFETFSRIIKQVYGEVEGKNFLAKLPVTK